MEVAKKIHISFADGGWMLIDPELRVITKSGNDWHKDRELFKDESLDIYIAVPEEQVATLQIGIQVVNQLNNVILEDENKHEH